MRLTINLEITRGSRRGQTLPEWIRKLADNISEKYRQELIEKEYQLHIARIVDEKGPAFFNDLWAGLEEYVALLRTDLGNSTLSGDLTITRESPERIAINKQELPFILFTAALNTTNKTIDCRYCTANPRQLPGPRQEKELLLYLRVSKEDVLSAAGDDHVFNDGRDLARHLMTLLFTV